MTLSSTCPNCGETLFRDDLHCPKCGSKRSELVLGPDQLKGATRALEATSSAGDGAVPTCSSCGAPRLASDLFCTVCGMPMADEAPPAPQEAIPSPPAPEAPPPSDLSDQATQSSTPSAELDGWAEVRHQLEEATLDEFEIVKELGRGGMAAVYLARDLALGRNVAIKVMAPGLLLGQGMVDRFRQEAVTIANLQHPNIITIHTVRQAGTLHFFVMQLVEGGSLEGVLERTEPLPVALVQTILYQLGTGLAHAHRSSVIHRDIKPANVLLDEEGNAILTDFGIAKVTTASNLTQTGSTIGTPAYMSPEQCKAAELTSASDQYSLGVVAYEMLVGRAPFAGSPFEIMQAHTSSPPHGIREQREDCPPELEAAVLRMMAKDPEDRFPSVAEAIEAVGGYLPGPQDPLRKELARLVKPDAPAPTAGRPALTPIPAKTPVPTSAPGSAQPRKKRGRLPFVIGGVAGVATIVTVALLSPWSSSPGDPDPAGQDPAAASSVVFENPSESLVVGATVRVAADIRDAGGGILVGQPVTWSTDDPTVATVEGDTEEVVVTGVGPGTASIQADVGGILASFMVDVSEPAVGELTVSASSRELILGEQLTLTAILTDESGERVVDPVFSWTSSDPGVAQVDPRSGVVTARSLGRTQVTASAGDQTGRVNLRVVGRVEAVTVDEPTGSLEAGGTSVVRALVTSRPEGYVGAEGITWLSSNPSVASVTISEADSAVLTLLSEGETVLTAETEGVQGALTLRVAAPTAPVTLDLSSSLVSFEAMEGRTDPSGEAVVVTVTGDATPTVGPVDYRGGGSGWLRAALEPVAGGGASLTLQPELGTLAAGSYQAGVPVSAGEVTRVVEVRFTVTEDPTAGPVEPNAAAEQGVTALLAQYASAINNKNTNRLRELFPTLPQDAINDLLTLRETDTYLLQLVPGSLRLGAQEGTLDGDVMSSVLGSGNRGEAVRMIYTFGRGDQGWYLVSLRAGG